MMRLNHLVRHFSAKSLSVNFTSTATVGFAQPQFWNSQSEIYDQTIGGELPKLVNDVLVNLLQPSALTGNILDLGCGTGFTTAVLNEKNQARANIFAVDFSPQMLEKCEQKFPRSKFPHITIQHADAQDLKQFPSNHFSAVYSNCCVCFCPEPRKAIDEIYRVLKPKSQAVISTWYEPKQNPFTIFRAVLDDMLPEVSKNEGLQSFKLTNPIEVVNEFYRAGFSQVKFLVHRLNLNPIKDRYTSIMTPAMQKTYDRYQHYHPEVKFAQLQQECEKRVRDVVARDGGLYAFANIIHVTK